MVLIPPKLLQNSFSYYLWSSAINQSITLSSNWLLGNPKVHYRPYISSPLVPIFSKNIYSPGSQPTSFKFILILSSHLSLGLPSLFLQIFPLKLFMHFWIVPCMLHVLPISSYLDLRLPIMLGEEYNTCNSALSKFHHSLVILFLVVPNIFLGTSFLNTFNFCSLSTIQLAI